MKQNLFIFFATALLLVTGLGCKKDLDVQNPNEPTLADAQTEAGILSLATGAVYTNGFNGVDLTGLNWLGNSYFSLVLGYHELLGDVISAEASNQNINVLNLPDYVVLDDGSRVTNTSPSKEVLRISNTRDKRSANAFYYEWAYMYALNNACNNLLDLADGVAFTGDAEVKRNTIKAWAYWWKGFAYSRLGSVYYAGLINNTTNGVVSVYVSHNEVIAEATKNFEAAAALLSGITNTTEYSTFLGRLIPAFLQTGNGGVLTPQMWLRNINTMKARNLLVNTKVSNMTAAEWNNLAALTADGINSNDLVFTARTAETNGFFSASYGSVAAMAVGDPNTSSFKISERLIQDYTAGDKRFENNYTQNEYLNQVGGFPFSTRWALVDGGNGLAGVQTLANNTPGEYELIVAGSYEENELMKAEAKLYTSDIAGAVQSINAVRAYQGAGLPALSGGITLQAAKEALRRERRVSLALRGLSFYDARRWGISYDVAQGGGRSGAVVLTPEGQLNTNATINYNFLDYWDVPADEFVLNPPAAGSAPIKNPD